MKHGYTLIEILVGMTIIGLVFGLGLASFRDFSRRQALAGAAKNIQGDLRLAQQMALSGEKGGCTGTLDNIGFAVDSANLRYDIRAVCSGGPIAVKVVNLPSGITISTPSPNPIRFKSLGQGTNISAGGSAIITLTQAGTNNQATITVASGGEIK